MAERKNQNWEGRVADTYGPKYSLDVNNPQMGEKGTNVFLQRATTDNEVRQFCALDEDGNYYVHNEGNVEIVAGKKVNGAVGINIASQKANIAITCTGDGDILIKGSSVVIQAREDISLKAGRNISLNAPQTINLNSNKVQANGKIGNIMAAIFHVLGGAGGSFVGRVFSKSRVGRDKL
jgi:hypothetical protein